MTSIEPDRAGVYRAPADIEAVRSTLGKELLWIDADLRAVQNKHDLFEVLAKAGHFESTFGSNWDALADALQDLPTTHRNGYTLYLKDAGRAAESLGDAWAIFLEVLSATASYWRSRHKTFVVLVDAPRELPPWN